MTGPSRKRILIVAVNWMGDLIFMTPAIRALRRAFPQAHLACCVAPRGVELLEGNPHLDAVIPLRENRGLSNLLNWGPMISLFKRERFDTAFLFHRSFSRTAIAALSGIPSRIGYRTWKRNWLLTESAPMPEPDSLHKAEWFLRLLVEVGIPSDGLSYDAGLLKADEAAAEKLLRELGISGTEPVAALHPGANWHLKRWPAGNFARLADGLAEQFKLRSLFIGGPGDRELVQEITGKMRTTPLVATGRTTLRQMGALLKRSRLLVSNDSGPLHMGVAVGTPVIGLFGSTSPELTGPPGTVLHRADRKQAAEGLSPKAITLFGSIGCPVPCYFQACPKNLCMHEITVEQVLQAAGKFMS